LERVPAHDGPASYRSIVSQGLDPVDMIEAFATIARRQNVEIGCSFLLVVVRYCLLSVEKSMSRYEANNGTLSRTNDLSNIRKRLIKMWAFFLFCPNATKRILTSWLGRQR
jgi:hypothetical protein